MGGLPSGLMLAMEATFTSCPASGMIMSATLWWRPVMPSIRGTECP